MSTKSNNKTKRSYHPYQVPFHLYQKLESLAKEHRQKTGEDISWTSLLRNILEKELK